MLAVSISAPRFWSLSTSSLSEAAQAAKKTQPSVNWILCDFRFGSESWELVSLSDHLFNCSALLKRAEEFRFSNEVIIVESWETFRSQQFDEIYLKSFYLVKDWLQESSENVLILGTIQKRRTKVKCVCVLLYSRQQLEAANFLLKKRNGLERGVPQILRHLFTNKFISLFISLNFVSLCHVMFFVQAWNDKVSNLIFVGNVNVPSLHNYCFFFSNFSADFQVDFSWQQLKCTEKLLNQKLCKK